MPLVVTGSCDRLIFGLEPKERLRRQLSSFQYVTIVADACAVISEGTLQWLEQNRGIALVSRGGKRLAVVLPDGAGPDLLHSTTRTVRSGSFSYFNRKLRRRETAFGLALDEISPAVAHRRLFDTVYKGVTDLVTKWAWPEPAYHLTRVLASARVPPNAVTLLGIACMLLAAFLFARGEIGWGLGAAWLMTFLDTVDGKLARVTVQSSSFGNKLDHGTDILHPPLWWICLGYGVVLREGNTALVQLGVVAILASYVAGRVVEELFKRALGFNQFIWEPFDAAFRLVIARRNTILLIVTVGLLAGMLLESFLLAAGWSVASALIQAVRLLQGWNQRPIHSFLAEDDSELLAVGRRPSHSRR